MMRRYWLKTSLLATLLLLLSGCFFRSVDNLYAVPRPPDDFRNLNLRIQEEINNGAEYAAPLQGVNTQNVQLMDLDGDGVQEAIAFFRLPAESQMKIYIYHQTGDETYEVQAVIVSDGTSAINSITYTNLDDNPADKELVVSWQISSQVYIMGAYSIHGDQVIELIPATNYNDYIIQDIDKDNRKEILGIYIGVVTVDGEKGENRVDLYDYNVETKEMAWTSKVPMSEEIKKLSSKQQGFLQDYVPALFVTSEVTQGVVTDIFAWRDGQLVNLTLNPESGMSNATYRPSNENIVGIRDINRDGIMEFPIPTAFPTNPLYAAQMTTADNFWSIQWVQYDIEGKTHPVYTTYYNEVDGWYLVLPDMWAGKITLAREDEHSGERAVVFYRLDDENPLANPQRFLTIYKLTGANRNINAVKDGRFLLYPKTEPLEGDTYYAAKFDTSCTWDCGLDEASLAELFRLISSEWPIDS